MTPPQHHTVISAAAEGGKKRQSLRKEGGVGASGAEADTPREHWEGPGQKGRRATFLGSPSAAPPLPAPRAPPLEARLHVFSPGRSDRRNLSKQRQRVGGVQITTVPTS